MGHLQRECGSLSGTFGFATVQRNEVPVARVSDDRIGRDRMQGGAKFFQTKSRQRGIADRDSKHGDSNQEEISGRDYTMQTL